MTVYLKVLDTRLNQEEYKIKYATPGSCAIDLRACLVSTYLLREGETVLIPTGVAIDMQHSDTSESEQNFSLGAVILPRSGLGHKHGIVLGNLIGLVDTDYQGQVMVSLWNRSTKEYRINPMDRIAQLAFMAFAKPSLTQVEDFPNVSDRAEGGFGSTGI